ncbi:hypothetical protein AVEN_215198-1 [Araneus ventricosus]|uniref:Uncharacterized protein n=1 Tax=Araneus ventricosus TaxID=182803 RepID=A0A4Y2NE05_ARAVE|nr:hypothetical protein AVEN_215198-1 [Araneus ventricosus]
MSTGFVMDLMDEGFDLRKLRYNSYYHEKLLVSGGKEVERTGVMRMPGTGWNRDGLPLGLEDSLVNCLRYSDEGGECDASSFEETVEYLSASVSTMNQRLKEANKCSFGDLSS